MTPFHWSSINSLIFQYFFFSHCLSSWGPSGRAQILALARCSEHPLCDHPKFPVSPWMDLPWEQELTRPGSCWWWTKSFRSCWFWGGAEERKEKLFLGVLSAWPWLCPQIFLSIPQLSLFLLWDAQRFPVFSIGCSKPRRVHSEPGVVWNEGKKEWDPCLSPGFSQVGTPLSKDRELCHPHPRWSFKSKPNLGQSADN